MQKIRNVAILVHSLNSGGAERIAGLLSKALSKVYHVYLFLASTDQMVYEYGGTLVDLSKGGRDPYWEDALGKCKEKYRIDATISFLEDMNFANVRTRKNDKVILSERSTQSPVDPPIYAQAEGIRRYYTYADAIVTCAYGVEYDLQHHFGVKTRMKTIYNFIHQADIHAKAENATDFQADEFLRGAEFFVNIGRLHPQKNQMRLIHQFAACVKKHHGIKLLILGSGRMEESLRDEIQRLHLASSIKILPYTKNPFVYIKRAKAVILSSHYEGLPNVLLEAMTIGCPIIATDCLSGPRELLGDIKDYSDPCKNIMRLKRGILVCDDATEDDAETTYMAEAMARVLEDETMCEMFVKNQSEYMSAYSNEALLRQWIDVIEHAGKKTSDVLTGEETLLRSAKKLYIYGAGKIGTRCYQSLKDKYHIDGFVVSARTMQEKSYLGIPLYIMDEIHDDPEDTTFLMGAGGANADEIFKKIVDCGYKNIAFPFLESTMHKNEMDF